MGEDFGMLGRFYTGFIDRGKNNLVRGWRVQKKGPRANKTARGK